MNRLLRFARPGAFRLFLALVVRVGHSCRFDLGSWAVYCFFVLSGYWIHRMWTQKYVRTDQPLRVFYSSRLIRLLPAFWLANLLAAAPLLWGLTPPSSADHRPPVGWIRAAFSNTFLLGFADLPWVQSPLRVAWSLDVELQFYIFFPLLLGLCLVPRWGKPVFFSLLAAAVAGLLAYLIPADEGSRNLGTLGLFFLAGAAAGQLEWEPSDRVAVFSLLATVAVVGLCWLSPTGRLLFENNKHGATDFVIHIRRSAQAVLALVTAPFALKTVRIASSERDRRLGEISYAVYLMQWPVMMLHGHYFEQVPPSRRWPSLLGAWVVVALLSWLLFRWFDQPMERRRRRWVASHLPAA